MLLGVTPRNHQLTNLSAGREFYTASTLIPSVFRVIREDDPRAVLASFCNWHVLIERKILPYPKDFRDGWVYVCLTVDTCNGELRVCYDSDECIVEKLNQKVLQSVWTEPRKLYTGIGHGSDLYTVVDDLVWRDGKS